MSSKSDYNNYLRIGLVQALRKERYGKLCKGEENDSTHIATLLSQTITWSAVASLVLWLIIGVGFDFWQSVGIVGFFLLALVVFAAITKRTGTAALLIFISWAITGVISYTEGGLEGLGVTHFLPLAMALVAIWMWNAVALAGSVPFLLPLGIVVVFLPLLTQDLWVVGDAIGSQLIAVAIVSLGPLIVFTAVRYSRIDLKQLLIESIGRIKNGDPSVGQALEAIQNAPREETATPPPPDIWTTQRLQAVFDSTRTEEVSVQISDLMSATFRRQTILRLGRLVVGTAASFALFIYLLAWAAIPISTSSSWVKDQVSTTQVEFAFWNIALPTGPYIAVSALLAVVATAAFIAFALTEDRYSTAVSELLVQQPAEKCALLGVPYVDLFKGKE